MQQLSNCGCILARAIMEVGPFVWGLGLLSRALPQTVAGVSRAGKSGAAGCSPCICWAQPLHPLPRGCWASCLQTRSCVLALPPMGDQHPSICGALLEALLGRERQGKRAAASQLSLCQAPAQKSYAGLQIKEFQIVVARNSKSSQMNLQLFGKCCSGETTQLHLCKKNVRFLSVAPALIPQAAWFHSCCT